MATIRNVIYTNITENTPIELTMSYTSNIPNRLLERSVITQVNNTLLNGLVGSNIVDSLAQKIFVVNR